MQRRIYKLPSHIILIRDNLSKCPCEHNINGTNVLFIIIHNDKLCAKHAVLITVSYIEFHCQTTNTDGGTIKAFSCYTVTEERESEAVECGHKQFCKKSLSLLNEYQVTKIAK